MARFRQNVALELFKQSLHKGAPGHKIIITTIINMLMPIQQNSFTHLRVLLVLTDRGILAQFN
jgi:hypothetical protein